MVTAKEIKALREKTGDGMGNCKRALELADGDEAVAIAYLRSWTLAVSIKGKDGKELEGYERMLHFLPKEEK